MTLAKTLHLTVKICTCGEELAHAERLCEEIEDQGDELLVRVMRNECPIISEDTINFMQKKRDTLQLYENARRKMKTCPHGSSQ